MMGGTCVKNCIVVGISITYTDTVMLYVTLNKWKLVAIQYYHVYCMGSPAVMQHTCSTPAAEKLGEALG